MHPFLRPRSPRSCGAFFLKRGASFREAELGEEGGLVLVGEGLGACHAREDVEDLGVAGGVDLGEEEEFVHVFVFLFLVADS